jgi:hypothetical protein
MLLARALEVLAYLGGEIQRLLLPVISMEANLFTGQVVVMSWAHRHRFARRALVAALLGVLALVACLLATPWFEPRDWPRFVTWTWSLRRMDHLVAYEDVRWVDLRHLDLRQAPGNLLPTLGFNQR